MALTAQQAIRKRVDGGTRAMTVNDWGWSGKFAAAPVGSYVEKDTGAATHSYVIFNRHYLNVEKIDENCVEIVTARHGDGGHESQKSIADITSLNDWWFAHRYTCDIVYPHVLSPIPKNAMRLTSEEVRNLPDDQKYTIHSHTDGMWIVSSCEGCRKR